MRSRFVYILLAGSLVGVGLLAARPAERYFDIAKNLDIFATLYKEVNTFYVDEVNPNTLIKEGIDRMLESLDPYTNYIPEDEIEDFRTMTTGQYAGIGAVIGRRNNIPTVMMNYDGYPAQKAGLLIGDEVLEVDGIELKKRGDEAEITKLLKGQSGTKVKLKIRRFGKPEPFVLELTRERIKINNVPYYGMIGADVGYIQLKDFNQDAGRDVKKALTDLKEKGAKSIMLDLRDNPGGLLNEAVNICNLFLPKDLDMVATKGKVTEWNKQYRSLSAPVDTSIPVAVLVNNYAASASEIVSGVMQDYDRGVLVGVRTYGKGLVQTTRPLSYNGTLKVTTAKYYIPSGRCIQAIDYSHRSAEGKALVIADSARMAFKTRRGRPVYDGGGVSPDIEIKNPSYTPIAQSLLARGHIFDYATAYRASHPTIATSDKFSIDDAEYAKFTAWLQGKEYDYTTKVESSLTELEEFAKKENYYAEIKDQVDGMRKRMSHNKEHDLAKNKKEIAEALEQEILSRYYLERGIKESSFDSDPQVLEALAVLRNLDRYKAVLAGTGK
jgi:carboxyl-terminal processing protease